MAIDNVKNIRIQSIIPRELKEDAEILTKIDGMTFSKFVANLIQNAVDQNRELIDYRKKDTE